MSSPDFTETGARLRVLWNRGRQIYSTFFAELATVRQEFNDDARFADWCFYDLKISVSILQNASALLKKADTKRVQDELMLVKRFAAAEAKAKKDAERLKKQQQRDEKTEADKREERRRRQRERRARIKDETKSVRIPENPRLIELIAEVRQINKVSRAECGRRFTEMQRMVNSGEAGRDEFGKKWRWQRWATLHIDFTVRWVNKCIEEFRNNGSQNDSAHNVVPLVNISGIG